MVCTTVKFVSNINNKLIQHTTYLVCQVRCIQVAEKSKFTRRFQCEAGAWNVHHGLYSIVPMGKKNLTND